MMNESHSIGLRRIGDDAIVLTVLLALSPEGKASPRLRSDEGVDSRVFVERRGHPKRFLIPPFSRSENNYYKGKSNREARNLRHAEQPDDDVDETTETDQLRGPQFAV